MVLVKSVYPIILCVLTLAFRSTAEAETPSPENVLVGSVHTIVFEFSRGSEDGEVVCERSVTTYDPQGRVIESKDVECGRDRPGSEGKSRSVYTYDAEGKRKEVVHYSEDGSVFSKRVTFFDDKGNSTEDIDYHPDGSRGTRYTYRLDDKGNRVETITYRSDGSILARETYANGYDEQGNRKEEIYDRWDSREDFDRHHKTISSYDEKGRISELLSYEADESLWGKLEYALFGKRKYILRGKRHFTYYANGYRSEEIVYNGGGALESKSAYAYEFDSVGNWTKTILQRWVAKKDKLEAEAPYIATRTITYYEFPNDERN